MKYFICLFIIIPFNLLAQNGVSIYANYIVPIHKQYVLGVYEFQKQGYKVNLNSFNIGISSQIYKRKKISIRLGIDYQFVDLILHNKLDSVSYRYEVQDSHGEHHSHNDVYYFTKDKPDFHNQGHKLALNLSSYYYFGKRNEHNIGLVTNFYLLEFNRGFYKSLELDDLRKKYEFDFNYLTGGGHSRLLLNKQYNLSRNFFLSAVDLNLFYQFNWILSPNFSLGLRASIGTNLYSDWNQFKKYLWAGFGLHVGFLKDEKVRLNKKEL
jgi:hypothetical protein